jgi:SAM-dependent methyltransferase
MSERIDYSVVDLDDFKLQRRTYDAIFAISSAHHVTNLENLFRQCRRALKPGVLLFLEEYMGPSRFQTKPRITELINRLLAVLPPRYRMSLFANDGSTIDRYEPSPLWHFEKHDPSEAVRSAEIVAVLRRYFEIIEFRPFGGAIQHMLRGSARKTGANRKRLRRDRRQAQATGQLARRHGQTPMMPAAVRDSSSPVTCSNDK